MESEAANGGVNIGKITNLVGTGGSSLEVR